ncbi:MAG: hypothetical protein ACYDDB_08100 [bacterium]
MPDSRKGKVIINSDLLHVVSIALSLIKFLSFSSFKPNSVFMNSRLNSGVISFLETTSLSFIYSDLLFNPIIKIFIALILSIFYLNP